MAIDFTTPAGQNALARLQKESVIWLTVTSADGTPQPNPVWFVWHNDAIYVFTHADSAKAKNLRRKPQVSMHFNTDARGMDVVIFTGSTAITEPGQAPADVIAAYTAKYGPMIAQIMQMPLEDFFKKETAVKFTPAKLR